MNYEKVGQYEAEVLGLRGDRAWGKIGREVLDPKNVAAVAEAKIAGELQSWPVYNEANTRAMSPKNHRLFLFIEIFLRYADRNDYCTEASKAKRLQGQAWTWHKRFQKFHRRLRHEQFRTHFNKKGKFLGIICPKGMTEWVRFDIDNHDCKDNDLFFQRVAGAYEWFV